MRRWVLDGGSGFGSDSVHDMPRGLLQPRPRDVVLGVPDRDVLRRGGVVMHFVCSWHIQRRHRHRFMHQLRCRENIKLRCIRLQ